jgi:hypothetical protein
MTMTSWFTHPTDRMARQGFPRAAVARPRFRPAGRVRELPRTSGAVGHAACSTQSGRAPSSAMVSAAGDGRDSPSEDPVTPGRCGSVDGGN